MSLDRIQKRLSKSNTYMDSILVRQLYKYSHIEVDLLAI